MNIVELVPTSGRKYFWGKAHVLHSEDGSQTLLSYGTKILRINTNGSMERLWGGWTATTGRHIVSFCGLNKKEFLALDMAA